MKFPPLSTMKGGWTGLPQSGGTIPCDTELILANMQGQSSKKGCPRVENGVATRQFDLQVSRYRDNCLPLRDICLILPSVYDFKPTVSFSRACMETMEQSTATMQFSMSPYRSRSPFRLTHCMTEGQMTPPSSPTFPPLRNGPRLQLSRLLRRSKSMRLKQSGLGDRSHTASTHPSLFELRVPCPLFLPDSPSATESDSTLPSPGLRRMSTSYNNLYALAQRQANSSPVTPLLPSPICRQGRDGEQTFFKFHNPRDRISISSEGPIDSLQILAYYCSDADDDGEQHAEAEQDDFSRHMLTEDDGLSSSSDSLPVTPDNQESGVEFRSDESDWLANTTSHEERRRRFKARFYQVVQHPCTEVNREHGEDEVVSAQTAGKEKTN